MPERVLVKIQQTFGDRIIVRLQGSLRGRNALLNIFELWVALAGVITGSIFFYSPASIDKNALALTVGYGVAAAWSVGYFMAGLVIWWGMLKPSPRIEVAGLWLLGSATAVNGIAIGSVFGLRGTATSVTLLALTVAAWVRAMLVMRVSLALARTRNAAPS